MHDIFSYQEIETVTKSNYKYGTHERNIWTGLANIICACSYKRQSLCNRRTGRKSKALKSKKTFVSVRVVWIMLALPWCVPMGELAVLALCHCHPRPVILQGWNMTLAMERWNHVKQFSPYEGSNISSPVWRRHEIWLKIILAWPLFLPCPT